ncbi:MAG: DUF2959 domain-containing protein [Acidobacteriota bacterium]
MPTTRRAATWILLLTTALTVAGCDGCRKQARDKYFDSLESLGFEKRSLLVKRVDKARDAQEEAQEQFESALEQFQALIGHDGGELETVYDKLNGEYEDADRRATEVRERIEKVENVAGALFDEWRREIAMFENASYRRQSEATMQETLDRYTELLATMQRAAKTMDPVLIKLRDQVLFLKHNLNAQALGSLGQEAARLEADVGQLVREMKVSIAEADRFIAEMSKET